MALAEKRPKRGRGRPQKLGDYRALTIRIDAELYKQLKHLAVDRDESFNDLVAAALAEWWRGRPERAKYARRTVP
jgi:predicted HicB family RNase H-like nuclease